MAINNCLVEDSPAAFKESMCIMDCIYVMRGELFKGDYEKAIIATENALRSFKELRKMQLEKEKINELQFILQEAQKSGMGIVVIQRLLNG
ncbi:hypothetical protein [Siminovitchia terrae]|uniref:hypothetical protein n=1 Tax=Siminovitchia terrae TaxID=1914933 RepID=UPI0028B0F4D1|nr:hypothetical protein [Siminovitchia terrae]